MLAGGICRAEAGSRGTRLAFGANHFLSWLHRPGIRWVPPAGSPAKAGWWYGSRARGAAPPSGMSPRTKLGWGRPRPHFPLRTGKGFLLCPSFFKETLDQAPSQNSDNTQGMGEGRGSWGEAGERATEVTTYQGGLPLRKQAQLCRTESPCPYK